MGRLFAAATWLLYTPHAAAVADVTVQNEPLVVYGLVVVLLAAVVVAVLFSIPWRPLRGTRADETRLMADQLAPLPPPSDDLPWMPGGDILERRPGPANRVTPIAPSETPGDTATR